MQDAAHRAERPRTETQRTQHPDTSGGTSRDAGPAQVDAPRSATSAQPNGRPTPPPRRARRSFGTIGADKPKAGGVRSARSHRPSDAPLPQSTEAVAPEAFTTDDWTAEKPPHW